MSIQVDEVRAKHVRFVKIWSGGMAHLPDCGHVIGNPHLREAWPENEVAGCCLKRACKMGR